MDYSPNKWKKSDTGLLVGTKEGTLYLKHKKEHISPMELWYKKNWLERGERELSGVMKMFHQVFGWWWAIFKIRRTEHFRSVDIIVLDWTSAKINKCCLLLYYSCNQSSHQQHCKLGGRAEHYAPQWDGSNSSVAPTFYGPFKPSIRGSLVTQHTHDSRPLSSL